MRRVSLSRRLLWSVGGSTVAVAVLAATVAFFLFLRELEARKSEFLAQYVAERAAVEAHPFDDLEIFHASAAEALRHRLKVLEATPDAEVAARFDALFPLRADGTRRSRPELYDGVVDPRLGRVYGMGAFLTGREPLTMADKRLFVAAFEVVRNIGEAQRSRYDNFYFYTPKDQLIMFAPTRADRLIYYRQTAPADFSIRGEEMVQMTLPGANPARTIRCTKLRFVISEAAKGRQSTGCSTPVDVGGRHAGAFGSSVFVTNLLSDTVNRRLPGTQNLIVEADGGLIAYPGFARPGEAPKAVTARVERDLGLKALMRRVAADRDGTGVTQTGDGRTLVAYGRLGEPGWYLLIRYPKTELVAAAARSVSVPLLVCLLAAALQALLVVRLTRRTIALPLRALALAALDRRQADALTAARGRRDEIGTLARALERERRKVQSLLASLEARVRARTAELEAAHAAKSRFLANMSHELRTPLNGVIAVAEVLERTQETEQGRENAALIASSGRLLERVVGDILDFSKLEEGQVRLEARPFDLEAVLERIAALHRSAAEAKGLVLTLTVSPAARGGWTGDETRITQIVSNLLSNAVKFTDSGGVFVSADTDASGALVIEVADTGPGFGAEVASRLFRPFEQADASVTRRYGGTGLGLAICAALAKQMGGGVEADGWTRPGARFSVRLPLPRDTAAVGETASPPPVLAGAKAALADILLAEDHPVNQKVVALILSAAGHRLTVVADGAAAIEAHAAQAFDLILMDMQMPVMDGLSATRAIRAGGDLATPIVMLTANALDEHVQAAVEAGADRHIAKPVRAPDLLAAIAELLAARDGGRRAVA